MQPATDENLATAASTTIKATSKMLQQQQQQQQYFQPQHLATVAPCGEQVHLTLSNWSTWRKFSRQNTEMIVTKVGRRMFPSLSLDIRGLDPVKKYEVYVTLMLADRHTLKYQRGVWLANGQGEAYPPPGCTAGLTYVHPDSPAPGKHWTRQEVTFMRLKLTNKLDGFASEPSRNGTMIFAYSMHKYLPVVHIREISKNDEAGFYTAATFPGTEFITVTAYQNPELTDLKIQFNPYAKGIRNQGDRYGPLLIDSFRPTVQALQQQQQQLPTNPESAQCLKVPRPAHQYAEKSPSVEFGSYPHQTELSYGRWSVTNSTDEVFESSAATASHRHRPYSVASATSTAVKWSASQPHPEQQVQGQFSIVGEPSSTTQEGDGVAQDSEFSQQFSYNPYSWYLPSAAQQQQQQQHYYYQQYQQAYQQQSAQLYYPSYCFQQQQTQQQLTIEQQQNPQTPQAQIVQSSTLLHNATDSSPSGLSFEHTD